jgi:hypothetical protein
VPHFCARGCRSAATTVDLLLISRKAESLAALDDILRQYQAEGHDISAILGMSRKRKRVAATVPDGTPRGQIPDGGSAGRSSAASGPEASPAARTRRTDSGSATHDALPVTPSAAAATTRRVNGHAPVTPSRGSREAAIVVDDDSDADMSRLPGWMIWDLNSELRRRRKRRCGPTRSPPPIIGRRGWPTMRRIITTRRRRRSHSRTRSDQSPPTSP